MEEPKLHSCLILYGFFILRWKLDHLWRVLETPSQLPAPLEVVQTQISHLSPIREAQPLRCWYRSWSGVWGGRERLLSLWLKLFHCAEKPSKFNRSKRDQEEIWLYHLAVCTVTWQKELCVPSLLLHISACFYMEKSLDNIKKPYLILCSLFPLFV